MNQDNLHIKGWCTEGSLTPLPCLFTCDGTKRGAAGKVTYSLLSSPCRATEHAVFTVPSSADEFEAPRFPST